MNFTLKPAAVAYPREAMFQPLSAAHVMDAQHNHAWRDTHQRVQVQPSAQRVARHTAHCLFAQAENAADAKDQLQSHLTTARLKLWGMSHGADATQLLAMLMVVLGTPCECGARQYGNSPAWVRQLHGALRTISKMCDDDYRWDQAWVPTLDRAIEIATEHRADLDRATFIDAYIEANAMANAIEKHQFSVSMIA